ncbi:uncharacterized protein [Lepeophtheirus salmonis]|uniref:uncharacterized protein n=1 Tax=Lepeophtheirus salmonis TaxID=72036 RepID=UPI001AE3F636|nr:uncharacterized protein LOC121124346 [Lepeophtheirus salmonis]
MLSEEVLSILDTMSDVPKNLLKRMQIGSVIKGSRNSNSTELQAFGLTLSFYSTKAHSYVRNTFDLCLPSLSTIQNWCSNVNSDPGFNQSSFDILKSKANKALQSKEEILVNLTLEEMSVFKKNQWNGKRFNGYVNVGLDEEELSECIPATQVLAFIVVSLNQNHY